MVFELTEEFRARNAGLVQELAAALMVAGDDKHARWDAHDMYNRGLKALWRETWPGAEEFDL